MYKIIDNIQKFTAFLYSNYKLSERKFFQKNLTHNCMKMNKIPGNKSNQRCEKPIFGKL